jgi:hypothetical protein
MPSSLNRDTHSATGDARIISQLDAASGSRLGSRRRVREGGGVRYLLLIVAGCGAAQHGGAARALDGGLTGLARDHDSGEAIAKASIHVRAQGQMAATITTTAKDGAFALAHLAPGKYSLSADFAGQQINVDNITIKSGDPTVVDVTFDLGHPDPITVDFGTAKDSEIDHYHPQHHTTTALIEGTVNDRASRSRVAGAVVTAIGPGSGPSVPTLQAVSDDQGRYRFDPVPPGVYVVSAYYSVGNRGQIEVRRSDIEVDAAQGVRVPLWVETEQ